MLKRIETEEVLKNFGKYLVTESRKNLTRRNSNDSRELYESLNSEVNVFPNSLSVEFEMLDYGKFKDKGVRGAGGVRKTTSKFNPRNNKGKLWKINAKDSPFSFKQGDKNKPSAKHFESWSLSRGLSPYAVREAVYHQGIEPTYFYSRPFELAFKSLPDEIVEAYGLDLENFIQITLKD